MENDDQARRFLTANKGQNICHKEDLSSFGDSCSGQRKQAGGYHYRGRCMDMGGNIGTQSSTIFTRAFVLGHINMRRFGSHLFREIWVGLSIGIIMGIAAGIIASIWQQSTNFGWAVGISLMLTMTIATALGFLVPFILVRIGFDQAAGSDPFITTIKDISGLVIYFSFVSIFLGHLL